MNGKPPVCPISRSQPIPAAPGRMVPNIPRAVNLPSAIAAANAINAILPQIVGPGFTVNNVYPPWPFGNPQLSRNTEPIIYSDMYRWKEVERARKKVKRRFRSDKEHDNWIDVEFIVHFEFTLEGFGRLVFDYDVSDLGEPLPGE